MTSPLPQKLEAQPLYAQVRLTLVDRLISGQWKPGQVLPSEFAIADELGVSQGTVRKALDDMTASGLLIRRQGRGTFVAEAEDQSILFRFYRLTKDDAGQSEATFPSSRYLDSLSRPADPEEQEVFGLADTDHVLIFDRLRSNEEQALLWERLVLPGPVFHDLSPNEELPNNVYQFYGARFGIIVARVNEKLKAVAASPQIAGLLDLEPGTPLLMIDRRAEALDGRVVEWRISYCRSDTMHYRNELA